MSSFQYLFYRYRLRLLKRLFPVTVRPEHQVRVTYQKIGSDYGFVAVPTGAIGADSVVYSVGAGLDVHSDVDMARLLGCRVHIFDPTPRAAAHFRELREKTDRGEPMHAEAGPPYQATPQVLDRLSYHEMALWDRDETVQFFVPENPEYVSHSITNILAATKSIDVPARRLVTLMRELGHSRVDYLKLDIEGAEFRVVDDLVDSGADVRVLYLEYHYDQNITPLTNIRMIQHSLERLYAVGFRVFYQSQRRYFGLMR
ncbi:MAG TPA: FkbM family methyltransferase [Saprospiraceae bacterium]|nr:FkbM family methyltransferase [Saprospiraceae bacterium]